MSALARRIASLVFRSQREESQAFKMASTTEDSSTRTHTIEIDLIGMVRRRWTHILLGLTVGIVLSAMHYLSTTPIYESQLEILVGQRSSELTNSGTITGANASGDAIQEDQLATHMRLFVGRKMLADAIRVGNLEQLSSFQAVATDGGSLIDHIMDNIVVQRGGEGSARDAMVLRASFSDPNPEDAALVLGAIYESYRDYVESHGQNSSEQAVTLIEEARATHEAELVRADLEYRAFIQSVPVLVGGDNVQDIHTDRLANIESELNIVRNFLAESTSRLEVIESYLARRTDRTVRDVDHLALMSQNEVERLKLFLEMTRGEAQSESFQAEQPMREEVARAQYNRLLDLIQKEKSFSDAFGPGHPMVSAVRQETEITRQFIKANSPDARAPSPRKLNPAEMLNTYTMLLRNDIAELEKRKQMLLVESATELRLAKQVEGDFMKGNALLAQLNRAQSRYDEVILRLQELNLARSYAGFSTDLLASPEPAKSAAWPNLPIVGAIGIVLGLGLGLVIAIAAELVDSTLSNVRELEQAVGAPAIAHVPRFQLKDQPDRVDPDSELDASLVAYHAPRSAESEVYRVARTSLMIANRRGSVQSMMMTSPQPGDGKSTTISNLAISFARTGLKVLLVDADMRRPVISGLFGLKHSCGLADILMGQATLEEATTRSAIPDLDIVPNGLPTSAPAELLESHQLARTLQAACRDYDLVLIDAPPLLAVADPAIIAPLVDSVILTVRINKNGRRPVEHAARILQDIDVKPAAVIVNGVDNDAKGSYGYGNYSRDQYGYVGHYHDRYAAADVEPEHNRSMIQAPHKPHVGPTSRHAIPGLGARMESGSIPPSQTPISS
jgi:succinoglycan biosynthesis transport protein ExoP